MELYPDVPQARTCCRAAQADVLIELAPGTTYTGERRCPTTAFASPITRGNTPRCSLVNDKE